MTTIEIIQGCKNGQRRCQAALYKLTCDDIMNICYRYLGNSSDAMDVSQDVYIKAFKKINTYDSNKGQIGGWMARIAINECLQYLRKRKGLVILNLVKSDIDAQADDDVISDMTVHEIIELVQQLPDGYRIVFNLYVVEGYNHNEIGQLLSISSSASRSQLARAKNALRKSISKSSNPNIYEKAE